MPNLTDSNYQFKNRMHSKDVEIISLWIQIDKINQQMMHMAMSTYAPYTPIAQPYVNTPPFVTT